MNDQPRLALRAVVTMLLGLAVTAASVLFVVRGVFIHVQEGQAASRAALVTKVALVPELRPDDFSTRPTPKRRAALDRLFRHDVYSAATVAATLYGRDGRVGYSTNHAWIGRRTAASTFALESATKPRVSARVQTLSIGGRMRKVAEFAIPIRGTGIVVISTDYGSLVHASRRTTLLVSLALVALVAMLFVALLPTVRRSIRQSRLHVRNAERHALRDTLTGLPNRRLFEDRVAQAIAQAEREDSEVAVMLVDLDRFKEINDTLGHASGDVMLKETAARLVEVLRETDTVARLGGDEFAVVISDASRAVVHDTAQRMQRAIETPVSDDGRSLCVGASIGISLFPAHARTLETLMRNADIAMYNAKRSGLGHVLFDPGEVARQAEDDALALELREALARDEIAVHYQPMVQVETGAVAGVEALLRWEHPLQGTLPAERFMPLAEQAGVRNRLYEFALEAAVQQTGAWRRDGLALTVAVNIDARMLVDRELPARFEALLEAHGVDADHIEVEIAETSLLGDVGRVTTTAVELAALGVILVVDDFGADHTSLNSLAYLPIHKLKLHRKLLALALESPRDLIMLEGVVELAHKLGLQVVAGGVESADALELLRRIDTDFAQGFYPGAPMPPAAVERLFELAA